MLVIRIISLKGIIALLAALPIIPFPNNCCETSGGNELNTIMVFSSVRAVQESDGKLYSAIDSFYIHSYEQYIMYQIPEIFEYWNASMDKQGTIKDRKFVGSEARFKYYVFKIGDASGYGFDSLGSKVASKFNVDSLVDTKTIFKQGISLDSYQLFKKITDSAAHFLTEKYVPKVKGKTTPDSSFLYFRNDWDDINFSFAKDLDLQKKSKLYKFRVVFNQIGKREGSFDVPRQELIFEIRRPEIKNPEQILELFKKVKDQQALNK
jgi:hypothetical protein